MRVAEVGWQKTAAKKEVAEKGGAKKGGKKGVAKKEWQKRGGKKGFAKKKDNRATGYAAQLTVSVILCFVTTIKIGYPFQDYTHILTDWVLRGTNAS